MSEVNPSGHSSLGSIRYWIGVVLCVLILLVLLMPVMYVLVDADQDLISKTALGIGSGACFLGGLAVAAMAAFAKKPAKPKGQVSAAGLIRYLSAGTGLESLSFGLWGVTSAALAALVKPSFFMWIFLVLAVLVLWKAALRIIRRQILVKRILDGNYQITLSELTGTTEEVEERGDSGNESVSWQQHDYYLYFADASIPREKQKSVTSSDYYQASQGQHYYLLVMNGIIMAFFPETECTLDQELKTHLVVELVSEEKKREEKEKRQAREAEILKSAEAGSAGSPQKETACSVVNALQTEKRARQRKHRILLIGGAAVTLVLLGLILTCCSESAYIFIPMALIPLLLGFISLNDWIRKKFFGVPENPAQPWRLTSRIFQMEGAVSSLLGGIAFLYIFLSLGWAAGCSWGKDSPGSLPGAFCMLIFLFGAPAVGLMLAAWFKYRKRKRVIQNRELLILELPVLRKECGIPDGPEFAIVFPDIERDGNHGILPGDGRTVMTEEKQVRIRVEKKEYHMISEGDLYYLFMLSRPNGEDTMLKYWRRDAICLDDEMSGFLGDLSVLQRRYDFAWKK